jgi:hypothetical protein
MHFLDTLYRAHCPVQIRSNFFRFFPSYFKKNVPNKYDIHVRRETVLEDSFRAITNAPSADYLKTRPWVIFDGEVGLDYGGVQR